MKNDELNEAVARAIHAIVDDPAPDHSNWRYAREGVFYKHRPEYAQSLDAFHKYVLPALEERGLMEAWAEEVASRVDADHISQYPHPTDAISATVYGVSFTGLAVCLAAPTQTKASAAIAVMQRKETP